MNWKEWIPFVLGAACLAASYFRDHMAKRTEEQALRMMRDSTDRLNVAIHEREEAHRVLALVLRLPNESGDPKGGA